DIGTFVLPNAEFKFYLTASVDERAKRRCNELVAKGEVVEFETIKKDIETRDYNDSHRAVAPLKKADDAVEIDTTYLNIEQVAEKLISAIRGE
ncbi:MAG: (d)CMP kinase, partial [Clostridia bacterium]|nr:(d)CMP kinase [Clostridia bacterium]